jgi:S1-C subfamily serine protease
MALRLCYLVACRVLEIRGSLRRTERDKDIELMGDTITSLDGQSVSSPDSLTTIIENEKPGASMPLVYADPSGAQQTVTVRLASGSPQ